MNQLHVFFSTAAARIVGKGKHYFRKHKLLVSLLSEAAESSDPEDEDVKLPEMDSSSVENGHAATNAVRVFSLLFLGIKT